jgi:hypothetical protein
MSFWGRKKRNACPLIGTQQFRGMKMREQRPKGALLKAVKRPKEKQTVEVGEQRPRGAHLSTAANGLSQTASDFEFPEINMFAVF